MLRRDALKLAGALALTGGLADVRKAHAATQTIKIGTLFPKASPWGKVFEVMSRAVSEKSGGKLELQFFYNGSQGDDDAMVGKIKAGQLDGAAITGVGFGKIYKPILALQLPLFSSWAKLDSARAAMKGEFEQGAQGAGFFLAGLYDVGLTRMFAKGFAIKVPDDLKGKKPQYLRADPIAAALYSTIGGVGGVSLNVPEVLPNLNTGAINALSMSSLLGEQLQWAGKMDNLNELVIGTAIGGLVFSQKRIDALPADLRQILRDVCKVAGAALTTKIRSEDDAAFGRLKAKMTVTTPSADDRSKWEAIFKQTRQKLAQGIFSADLVAKLEGFAK